jgi:alanyl-tRNA synthetase
LTEVYKIQKKTCTFLYSKEIRRERTIDQEAWDIWKELIDEDRIILETRKTTSESDQGPCGPCSEIHVDIRSAERKL